MEIFKKKQWYDERFNIVDKTQEEINKLTKKYQEEPDTLIKDYDNMINGSIIGIIANYTACGILRNDLISSVNLLIRIRKFIISNYSDYSSGNYNK